MFIFSRHNLHHIILCYIFYSIKKKESLQFCTCLSVKNFELAHIQHITPGDGRRGKLNIDIAAMFRVQSDFIMTDFWVNNQHRQLCHDTAHHNFCWTSFKEDKADTHTPGCSCYFTRRYLPMTSDGSVRRLSGAWPWRTSSKAWRARLQRAGWVDWVSLINSNTLQSPNPTIYRTGQQTTKYTHCTARTQQSTAQDNSIHCTAWTQCFRAEFTNEVQN